MSSGYGQLPINTLNDLGVPVAQMKTHSISVAEHALTLMLTVLRRIPASTQLLREGKWREDLDETSYSELYGKTESWIKTHLPPHFARVVSPEPDLMSTTRSHWTQQANCWIWSTSYAQHLANRLFHYKGHRSCSRQGAPTKCGSMVPVFPNSNIIDHVAARTLNHISAASAGRFAQNCVRHPHISGRAPSHSGARRGHRRCGCHRRGTLGPRRPAVRR